MEASLARSTGTRSSTSKSGEAHKKAGGQEFVAARDVQTSKGSEQTPLNAGAGGKSRLPKSKPQQDNTGKKPDARVAKSWVGARGPFGSSRLKSAFGSEVVRKVVAAGLASAALALLLKRSGLPDLSARDVGGSGEAVGDPTPLTRAVIEKAPRKVRAAIDDVASATATGRVGKKAAETVAARKARASTKPSRAQSSQNDRVVVESPRVSGVEVTPLGATAAKSPERLRKARSDAGVRRKPKTLPLQPEVQAAVTIPAFASETSSVAIDSADAAIFDEISMKEVVPGDAKPS